MEYDWEGKAKKNMKPSKCPNCGKLFKIGIEALGVSSMVVDGKHGWLCPHCKEVVEIKI